jgi:lactate dehydrogenase-like 2-hydroxyacid dehydrogenase
MTNDRPRVFVTRQIPAPALARLSAVADVDLWPGNLPPARSELERRVAGCAGLLSLLSDRIDGALLDRAGSSLRVISNYAVGVNNIDRVAARQRGIAVGNTPGALTDATADMAVLLLLAAARRFSEAILQVRQRLWRTWEPLGLLGRELRGRSLGIVGAGRIGEAVAERLHGGWQMQIHYTSRQAKPQWEQRFGARRMELDDLLGTSDFVSLHCDLNPSTHRMIDARRLSLMPLHAVLVNTSRGEVIDQAALYHALACGRLLAAGLDVTDPEPLPAESPLRSLPNCIIAPHIGSATVEARTAMAEIAVDNLLAGLEGRPLPHAVST